MESRFSSSVANFAALVASFRVKLAGPFRIVLGLERDADDTHPIELLDGVALVRIAARRDNWVALTPETG